MRELPTPSKDPHHLRSESVSPWQSAGLVAAAYALIVLCMWGVFAFRSGMPYETTFSYVSETSSLLRGFVFPADPLRLHTSTFYQVSYLLGEMFSPGSFVPYQFVYAGLWVARGLLIFLIVRRFLPDPPEIAYAAGALTLVHAADGSLQWIGQMNQFGFIFWMLLAGYLFVVARDSRSTRTAAAMMLPVMGCQYMSLWSYESGVFLIFLMPLAVFLTRWPPAPRTVLLCLAWYLVPAKYAVESASHYLRFSGDVYRQSVLRTDWSAASLATDWGFNISESLAFWKWGRQSPHLMDPAWTAVLASVAAGAFLGGGILLRRFVQNDGSIPRVRPALAAASLFVGGVTWVVFSFPAYLLLSSARSLWRTQILSGPGMGMAWAGAAALAAILLWSSRTRAVLSLSLAAVVVYYGASSAIQRGELHRRVWESQRQTIAGLLLAAPQVKPGTVIVLTGVPKEQDPFGHYMWFDMALRLAYPGTQVAGVYFLDDGSPNPGPGLHLKNSRWEWDENSMPPLVQGARLDETLVVRYEADGADQVAEPYPDSLCLTPCDAGAYAPYSRIAGTAPSPRAIRRYGPLRP